MKKPRARSGAYTALFVTLLAALSILLLCTYAFAAPRPIPVGGGQLPDWLLILCLPFILLLCAMWIALLIYFAAPIMIFGGAVFLDDYTGWGYWWCVLAMVPISMVICMIGAIIAEMAKSLWQKMRYRRSLLSR